MNIYDMLQQLNQPGARMGIGVWLLPRQFLGQEELLAVRLNLQPVDARQAYLDHLPKGARFSGLTRPGGHTKLVEMVRQLANGTHQRSCLLLHTLDLLLLGLEVDEREYFWQAVLELPYPRTKLILSIPENTHYLFPLLLAQRYAAWVAEGAC